MVRDLRADEIECRVATVKQGKGVSLLLYKNARCDMNILDETFGEFNWQRDHKELKGNIYCGIGIYDDNNSRWVWKWDCGAESYTEKEKGEASDSFKRAGFCWGIGRELYTAPFIWVTDCNITEQGKCFDKFYVSRIEIENKIIKRLEIMRNNIVVFSMGYDKIKERKPENKAVMCPKCGIQILNTPTQSGRLLSPEQVIKQWGMCENCFKEEMRIKRQLEQLKNERK